MRPARIVLLASFAALNALTAVTTSRCASCSEECSGDNFGEETCPCASDQDCSTRRALLLCREGTCVPGDPLDAPALAACSDDGECPAGQACGALERCFIAPDCQRISPAVALTARVDDTATFDVAAELDDCTHTWSGADAAGFSFTTTFAIGLDGTFSFPGGGDDCQAGEWHAARRVGQLTCGGTTVAIADATVTTCFAQCGDGSTACTVVGTDVGVCE